MGNASFKLGADKKKEPMKVRVVAEDNMRDHQPTRPQKTTTKNTMTTNATKKCNKKEDSNN